MFICTFYHTPVAFCDRGIVFLYYEGGVADATPPFCFFGMAEADSGLRKRESSSQPGTDGSVYVYPCEFMV